MLPNKKQIREELIGIINEAQNVSDNEVLDIAEVKEAEKHIDAVLAKLRRPKYFTRLA